MRGYNSGKIRIATGFVLDARIYTASTDKHEEKLFCSDWAFRYINKAYRRITGIPDNMKYALCEICDELGIVNLDERLPIAAYTPRGLHRGHLVAKIEPAKDGPPSRIKMDGNTIIRQEVILGTERLMNNLYDFGVSPGDVVSLSPIVRLR
jgi:hypothetical protein